MADSVYMKISELARKSGTPPSTIRYYVREGLLPPPVMTGKTSSLYTTGHAGILEIIKKKQIEEGLTLDMIKEQVQHLHAEMDHGAADEIVYTARRADIIKSATSLFLTKGYSETSIDDIVTHAQVGKGTFYQNFRSKDELFIECADRIFHDMYNDVWQGIKDEKDMLERLKKRTVAFFASYPKWVDMMNLVRGASLGENPSLKGKLEQVLRQMINPIIRDLQRFKSRGGIRTDLDYRVIGYMLMGMAEYAAMLAHRGAYPAEALLEALYTIFENGIEE